MKKKPALPKSTRKKLLVLGVIGATVLIVISIPILLIALYKASSDGGQKVVKTAGGVQTETPAQKAERLTKDTKFDAEFIIVKYKSQPKVTVEMIKKGGFAAFGAHNYLIPVSDADPKKYRPENPDRPRIETPQGLKVASTQGQKDKVKATLQKFLEDPEVEIAEPNYVREFSWTSDATTATPSDWNATNHWYLEKEHVREMWKDTGCPAGATCGGSQTVVVAVLDSGIAYEDFDDTAGYSKVSHKKISELDAINLFVNPAEIPNDGLDNDCNDAVDDYNSLDAYAWGLSSGVSTCDGGGTPLAMAVNFRKQGHANDIVGHGSIVTQMIASETNNATGVVSPAFNVKILPINIAVSNGTSGAFGWISYSGILNGLGYSIMQDVDVINMSYGSSSPDSLEQSYIDAAYSNGTILVGASGNSNTTTPFYPAAYPNVISVGALGENNLRATYSNYGSSLDLVAYVGNGTTAGTGIYAQTLSCAFACTTANLGSNTGKFIYEYGTSFASPQVAGFAAILKSQFPTLTNAEIKAIMYRKAVDIGPAGIDTQYGNGYIDFQKALYWQQPTGSTSINSGAATTTTTAVTLTISGTDDRTAAASLQMKVANNPVFTGASWEAYSTSKSWDLTAGSGVKAVFVKFLDSDGNESITYSDNITYNPVVTPPPTPAPSGAAPLYRFWSDAKQGHFYTINIWERDAVINNDPSWTYEGIAYKAYTLDKCAGKSKVYRFWSDRKQGHFYTISVAEKNNVINNDPSWSYEGEVFCVYATPNAADGSNPVYRFWSDQKQKHFYTISTVEKNNVINNDPSWIYEGIVFHAIPN